MPIFRGLCKIFTAARETIVDLRKQNYSVYEISDTLKERGLALSPTGVREVLKAEGFATGRSRAAASRALRFLPRTSSTVFF